MRIPRDRSFDASLAMLMDGYRFIGRRCRRYATDIFETRLMLRRAVCIMGGEAARVFYERDRFTRRGALPVTTLKLLQDRGSVQTLDGAAHRRRKEMFLSLMAPDAVERLAMLMAREWRARIPVWERGGEIVLLPEVQDILCRAVCAWAGVPLDDTEARMRTREFAAMIDGAGAVGPRNWRGMLLRARTERWARAIVQAVRAGRLDPPPGSALAVIASHRDDEGRPLDVAVAAVELLNVLRPTVAVALYIVFAALALHQHPGWAARVRAAVQTGEDAELEAFVQEVRRFYPFFPAVGGRVLREFTWHEHRFAPGAWVILDLHGTNHDPRLWDEPQTFRPERFLNRRPGACDPVPQGAGSHAKGHRCPGEWITIALMKEALGLLATAMRYDVPEQDLRIVMSRMPAVPRSRFVLRNVRTSVPAVPAA
ncbi:cytochrome P450 [Arenibaculum pallidiluteum]|uniref:cytochrome P450 n=1 Tax=Arenibaculum pallidiluteum TaxID=2812559 RepID=UPI001A95DC07|nr:cytochrome P450 [Arenibaculum pallidiluteum]